MDAPDTTAQIDIPHSPHSGAQFLENLAGHWDAYHANETLCVERGKAAQRDGDDDRAQAFYANARTWATKRAAIDSVLRSMDEYPAVYASNNRAWSQAVESIAAARR